MATFFSEHFGVEADTLEGYGAFNVSIVNDLPLFIDPFLLFNSEKESYVKLHDEIIRYLIFLREKSTSAAVNQGLLRSWYCFPEIKQNWLGFSVSGNSGSGLGIDFARALHKNLHLLFAQFGEETVTRGSHLEKVCLIADGVGRDHISDFTTNLICDYLCRYTQEFALLNLRGKDLREIAVDKAKFNYKTEIWERGRYRLPWVDGDYIILTPKDMLTRDENWINRRDMIENFEQIPTAIPDAQLRAQVSNYFETALVRHKDREPSRKERAAAATATIREFPELIDYYIRRKELDGDEAVDLSASRVFATEHIFVHQMAELQRTLSARTKFYSTGLDTYEEAHTRLAFLKDVIEKQRRTPALSSRWATNSTGDRPPNSFSAGLVRDAISCRHRSQ